MAATHPRRFIVVGAGAAGLNAARELCRAGKAVIVLEAQGRCGGRIYSLPAAEFGYPAEGGAEFVHGEAPVTRTLLREARLSLLPVQGAQWRARDGVLSQSDAPLPFAARFYEALAEVKADLPIGEFLAKQFAGDRYAELRRAITRMVEGYDAADPARASTLALREEWMGRGLGTQGRIAGGYGGLIDFLASESRQAGAVIHLGAVVKAIETSDGRVVVRCNDGKTYDGDAVIVTVPLPLLSEIALSPSVRERAAASAQIGFGNVVKILLRFATKWWANAQGKHLADLSFLFSDVTVPTWWTQHPSEYPVLTGWFGGPKTETVAHLGEGELVELGLRSLAESFALPSEQLKRELVMARAINWANDPFARGAYSYATPETRQAQSRLEQSDGAIFFSGEVLYRGRDMGTVEAALASGLTAARSVLASA